MSKSHLQPHPTLFYIPCLMLLDPWADELAWDPSVGSRHAPTPIHHQMALWVHSRDAG